MKLSKFNFFTDKSLHQQTLQNPYENKTIRRFRELSLRYKELDLKTKDPSGTVVENQESLKGNAEIDISDFLSWRTSN